jgi:hypothetical protein
METNQQKTPDHILRYMPSKKIKIIISIIILITILFTLKNPLTVLYNNIFHKNKSVPTPTIIKSVVEQDVKPLSVDIDTDGDGLADWQETLLGTDPNIINSKTDVPDSVRELVGTTSKDLITTEDKIALKVYQRLQSDPVGTNIVQAIQAATTKEVLDLANSIDKQFTTYGYDDLNLVENDTKSLQTYKSSLALFNKTLSLKEDVANIIYKDILTGEKTIATSTFQVSLGQAVNKLLEMPVPLVFVDQHISLLNSIAHINELLNSKQNTEGSILYASLLVFQKNINLARQSIEVILEII